MVNPVVLHAYPLGLQPPVIQLQLSLTLDGPLDLARMEAELTERFGVEPSAVQTCVKGPLGPQEEVAQSFAWLTLGLTAMLLQAVRIPCFQRGMVVEVQTVDPDLNHYQVVCFMSAGAKVYARWVSEAFERACLLLSLLSPSTTPDAVVAQQLEDLHEQFILEARKRLHGSDTIIPILKTADRLGIPFLHIGAGIYQLGWGARRHVSDRSATERDAATGARISHNKWLTARLLGQAGLPVPRHQAVDTPEAAVQAAQRIGYPVVVKPADRDRGEGVTVHLMDAEGVVKAYHHAAKLSRNVLVEKHIPGICHRILVSGDSSPYTVMRHPQSVEGDGVHTVQALIDRFNQQEARKAKHRRRKPLPTDELALHTLGLDGADLQTVLPPGVRARLRPIESTEWGGLPQVLTDQIHPENVRIAKLATRLLGLNLAGVDIISEDIRQPWYTNGAVINEMNYAPFLGFAYPYQHNGVEQVVKGLFPQGGRIPVEVWVGDQLAWAAALKRQQALLAKGMRAVVTSHLQTMGPDGEVALLLQPDGLFERVRAALMNSETDALLVVVQTDEPLTRGLPLDAVNTVHLVNQNLLSANQPSQPAPPDHIHQVLTALRIRTV